MESEQLSSGRLGRALRSFIGLGLLVLAVMGGCGRQEPGREPQTKTPVPRPAQRPEVARQSVRLLVLQGPGGSTLALVPVYIDGQGPFKFALDTGASHSVVDREVAERLRLVVSGPPIVTTGVAARSAAIPVSVDSWKMDGVELPTGTLVAMDLPDSDRQYNLQGLLGSDALSRFGAIEIDYDRERLTFRDQPPAAAQMTQPASTAAR